MFSQAFILPRSLPAWLRVVLVDGHGCDPRFFIVANIYPFRSGLAEVWVLSRIYDGSTKQEIHCHCARNENRSMRPSARMLPGAIEGSAYGEGSLPCCDAQSRRRFDIRAMSKLSIHLPMANDPLHSRSCNDISILRKITHGNLLNRRKEERRCVDWFS